MFGMPYPTRPVMYRTFARGLFWGFPCRKSDSRGAPRLTMRSEPVSVTPAQKNDPLFPKSSPLLKPLDLTKQELSDLQAFLFSLTEPKQGMRVELDR